MREVHDRVGQVHLFDEVWWWIIVNLAKCSSSQLLVHLYGQWRNDMTTDGATGALHWGPDPSEDPLRVHCGPHYPAQAIPSHQVSICVPPWEEISEMLRLSTALYMSYMQMYCSDTVATSVWVKGDFSHHRPITPMLGWCQDNRSDLNSELLHIFIHYKQLFPSCYWCWIEQLFFL